MAGMLTHLTPDMLFVRLTELMSTELAALVGESYERAYTDMIRVQQLTELEEVISYKRALARRPADAAGSDAQIAFIKELWRKRLMGAQRHVEVSGIQSIIQLSMHAFQVSVAALLQSKHIFKAAGRSSA